MRSGYAKFKQMRHFAAFGVVLVVLAGCTAMPARHVQSDTADGQPLHRLTVATPDAGHDVPALLMQAEFALDHGEMEVAQRNYAKASMLSDDPRVSERAVGLALALHDGNAARQATARWQALGGDRFGLIQARAQIALDQGRTKAAKEQLMQLTASGDKRAWKVLGRVLLGARDAAQAGHVLESIATPARLPDDPQAWLAMSELGQKLGRFDYAQRIADAAIKRFHSFGAYLWDAQLHAQRGENKAALALYAKAVKASPDNADARLAYAGLLSRTGRNDDAVKVLAQGRQDARTYAARAAFAARGKDMPALRRIYRQLKQAPDAVRKQSFYLLGQMAALLDQPRAAVDWLARVPGDSEHALDAGLRRAVLLQELGKSDQAHALTTRLADDFSDQPQAVDKINRLDAEIYMRDRQYRQAVAAYSRALAADGHDPDLLYGRGLAYAEAGNNDAAIADLRQVLKLKPDDVEALNALGYTLADSNRDLDEAARLLEKARAARPNDPAIADSWGWLQYRLGHLDKAETVLRASWDKHKDAEVGAHLAQVLLARGKRSQARKIYAAARRLDPDNRHLQALKGKLQP